MVAVVVAVLFLGTSPASAHATLERSTPSAGEQLDAVPEQILLEFSEPVEASLGAIQVYDSDRDRVDDGSVHHPEGDASAVALDLPGDLSEGSYVVTWRVISADAHPIHGAFTFQIGEVATGDTDALARDLLAADGGSSLVGGVFAAVRFVAFVALGLLVGGCAFVAYGWSAGTGDRRVRRVLWGSWWAALVATAVGIGLQGAYAGGLGLVDAVDPAVIRSVLDTRFGRVWLARIVLLAIAAVVLRTFLGREDTPPRRDRGFLVAAGVLGLAVLATPGLSGHASSDEVPALALLVDTLHVAAASLWLAGLILLAVAVLPKRRSDDAVVTAVPRFSRLAFGAVAALVATGAIQVWRQVGSWDALTGTDYGRVLSLKLGAFALMVALAGLSRVWVRRLFRPRDRQMALSGGPGAVATEEPEGRPAADLDEEYQMLRFSVAGEALIGLVVVLLTAILVNIQPAASALATPYTAELRADDAIVDVTIDPAKVGPATVHAYTLTPDGAVSDVQGLTMTLTLADGEMGPLDVPLERAGPGHYSAYDFDLPIAGEWELEVRALVDDFTEAIATDTVRVR